MTLFDAPHISMSCLSRTLRRRSRARRRSARRRRKGFADIEIEDGKTVKQIGAEGLAKGPGKGYRGRLKSKTGPDRHLWRCCGRHRPHCAKPRKKRIRIFLVAILKNAENGDDTGKCGKRPQGQLEETDRTKPETSRGFVLACLPRIVYS